MQEGVKIHMALSNIFGWNEEEKKQAGTACGTACGAGDKQ